MSTSIQWTDETWNPVTGCTRVSEGCRHCYIERTPAFRMAGRKFVNGTTGIQLHPDRLEPPLHWKKPRRVFVNSLSDLFHEDVPDEFIEKVLTVMSLTPQHTYQVLTKRPERMRQFFTQDESWLLDRLNSHAPSFMDWDDMPDVDDFGGWPMEHLLLGVSVEDQQTADERIPILLQTPAAVRFVSAEPLLGPILFRWAQWDDWKDRNGARRSRVNEYDGLRMLDWVIVGGESGPKARPTKLEHIRWIVQQCQEAEVPVFVKQLGSEPHVERDLSGWPAPTLFKESPDGGYIANLKDHKGGEPAEWPSDLRVREWPR